MPIVTLNLKPVEILLIEDNPVDATMTKQALREGKIKVNLNVVTDGVEAIKFLKRSGMYEKTPRPDLILLDLNLPKKSGREVLQEIKSDGDLKTIPVVVLTTSKAEEDIVKSYELHANCFISKPVDLDRFTEVVKSIEDFWFTVVKLPDD
ncbi:response regulator [Desulfomonile tiedjei]|uniref:Response regulator with CheY-like receiver domain and winged-helix DNA-binding domain n=1 Tax=Desulfomonile tiedjei (strain ATCC 49306 / DSM 6799 / DCB-1) TaxID=706587 RepID=I4C2I4_DESTA|nr:response regulator [Desulfomonile tiedjei]AFM23775.1 response regulator with CheY-like receiver domain and winged-helix DNA-binding domain [Desulfomonile tiedjei DSM 6799]